MYLVTGGAGFIGSHIAKRLLEIGEEVRILDNFSTGNRSNLDVLQGGAEVIEGDIRDTDALTRATRGIQTIFHQAAEPSVPRSIDDPASTYDINVTGTLNVLQAARAAGCARVVFASSSAVYGDAPEMPKHESMLPALLSPYASSKLAGEGLCQVFSRAFGFDAVALRYFNVFGPRQDPNSAYAAVIPRFLAALTAGERPVIYGDGGQSRDFIYIDNIVDANLKAAVAGGVAGKVFNIAAGTSVTLNQMLAQVAAMLDVDANPHHEPERAGDIRHSLADITAARENLGFEVTVPFEEGMRRTVASLVGGYPSV
ncbi:MAG: SDR family oxidoreductase [Thermomicrobiales bacterium]|nr:SDR family oxidoreductase [Thermomicrobiales bacterium]